MTNDDWFDWQMGMLVERVERFAQLLRSQLCVAESLFEEAQAWFSATHLETRPINPSPAKGAPGSLESITSPPSSVRKDQKRGVDEVVAEAQRALDSSFRRAFAAGERQAARDLKRKMEALLEELSKSDSSSGGGARS